jgi:tripartite-type tricarboxylate transporter receptor subunit TctC
MRDRFLRGLVALFVLSLSLGAAHAEEFPVKGRTLTLIVPFPPGGASDVLGRMVAQKLGEMWGVNAIVENRAGGESMIGAAAIANSRKDGYTLGLFTLDFVLNRIVQTSQPYDAVRDFTPVGLLATSPLLLVVNGNSPIKSLADLQAVSKSKPDSLTFSSCCSVMYFSTEMLKGAAKLEGLHIPYKGSSPSVAAVLSGETVYAVDTPLSIKPHLVANKLRALAVTSRQRVAGFEGVPNLTEAGVPGDFELGTWWGMLLPSGVPQDVVNKTSAALQTVMNMPDVKQRLADLGLQSTWSRPEAFGALMQSDYLRYAKTAKDNKLEFKH